jgi:hypothetical protein
MNIRVLACDIAKARIIRKSYEAIYAAQGGVSFPLATH